MILQDPERDKKKREEEEGQGVAPAAPGAGAGPATAPPAPQQDESQPLRIEEKLPPDEAALEREERRRKKREAGRRIYDAFTSKKYYKEFGGYFMPEEEWQALKQEVQDSVPKDYLDRFLSARAENRFGVVGSPEFLTLIRDGPSPEQKERMRARVLGFMRGGINGLRERLDAERREELLELESGRLPIQEFIKREEDRAGRFLAYEESLFRSSGGSPLYEEALRDLGTIQRLRSGARELRANAEAAKIYGGAVTMALQLGLGPEALKPLRTFSAEYLAWEERAEDPARGDAPSPLAVSPLPHPGDQGAAREGAMWSVARIVSERIAYLNKLVAERGFAGGLPSVEGDELADTGKKRETIGDKQEGLSPSDAAREAKEFLHQWAMPLVRHIAGMAGLPLGELWNKVDDELVASASLLQRAMQNIPAGLGSRGANSVRDAVQDATGDEPGLPQDQADRLNQAMAELSAALSSLSRAHREQVDELDKDGHFWTVTNVLLMLFGLLSGNPVAGIFMAIKNAERKRKEAMELQIQLLQGAAGAAEAKLKHEQDLARLDISERREKREHRRLMLQSERATALDAMRLRIAQSEEARKRGEQTLKLDDQLRAYLKDMREIVLELQKAGPKAQLGEDLGRVVKNLQEMSQIASFIGAVSRDDGVPEKTRFALQQAYAEHVRELNAMLAAAAELQRRAIQLAGEPPRER